MSIAFALDQIRARPWQAQLLSEPTPIDSLPTPALVLNRSVLKANILKMETFLANKGLGFRPHSKTHKCPLIAQMQLAAGAVGVCTAKLSEAVVMGNAGIQKILVTSPIATAEKAQVVAELATQIDDLIIVVDSKTGFDLLLAAVPQGTRLGVLVDIDVIMGRTGMRETTEIVEMAARIQDAATLEFRGVQHYAGHIMHMDGIDTRRQASHESWSKVQEHCFALTAAGMAPGIVTGGGTGTYNIDCDVPGITDLQVGSYIFMDAEYQKIGGEKGPLFDDFEVSLTILTTAISQPMPGVAITVDGGYKAFASDTVNPEPMDLAGHKFRFGGDEHGFLKLPKGAQQAQLGDTIRFVTPHCDPTVNLHDGYWITDDSQTVVEYWPIAARGCSW